jgi:hypothetical protein
MYLSKIWVFLLTLLATAALAIALLMPRPAQRVNAAAEQQRLATACNIINILLTDQARQQVGVAAVFGTAPDLVAAMTTASNLEKIDDATNQAVLKIGRNLVDSIDKADAVDKHAPDFAMLLDKHGRVVARIKVDDKEFGDIAAGRPIIDDALAGYNSDDIWVQNQTMYLVRGAPIVRRDSPVDYVGAVILGHAVNPKLAGQLAESLASPGVQMGFFLGKDTVALSKPSTLDNEALNKSALTLTGATKGDCVQKPLIINNSLAVVARLPGEAALKHGYYAVLFERPAAVGFMGTLNAIDKSDLAPPGFPWALLASGFGVALALGVGFMILESDRPLKRLAVDAVRLGKGETERLAENDHGGKFGSIARSVNIHIDKVARDAKSAKQDLDGLLGPSPQGSLGTIDLLAAAMPSIRPGASGPIAAPPPSEFKFSDPARDATPTPRSPPPAVPRPTAKPVAPVPLPGSMPMASSRPAMTPAAPPLRLDEDILGGEDNPPVQAAGSEPGTIDPYFKQIFDQFIALKKTCGEPIAGVTFGKFADKLDKNRAELIAKTGCRDVRFTVYVKDGKAALKASPVRDEA